MTRETEIFNNNITLHDVVVFRLRFRHFRHLPETFLFQTDRQADRHTDKQTDRERQIHRQMHRQPDRQTDSQTGIQTTTEH